MNTPEGSAPTGMELLDQANGLPFGSEERDLLQRALSSAQETGDRDAEYRVRLSLVASYRAAEDNSALLTHFSAAAGLHDSDPQRFPGSSDGSYPHLFWYYKHAINVVTMSCLFSRPQADALLDQMATHHAPRPGRAQQRAPGPPKRPATPRRSQRPISSPGGTPPRPGTTMSWNATPPGNSTPRCCCASPPSGTCHCR